MEAVEENMQGDKAEQNGRKDNLSQVKEEMMKREGIKDLTAVPHVAGDELSSERQVESSLCIQLTRPVSW